MAKRTGPFCAPAGYRWIFRRHFRHWRSGKLVYRKDGGVFAFLVRA